MTKGKKASNYKYLTKNKKAKQRCTQFIKAYHPYFCLSWLKSILERVKKD